MSAAVVADPAGLIDAATAPLIAAVVERVDRLLELCAVRPAGRAKATDGTVALSPVASGAPLAAAILLFNKSNDAFKEAYLKDLLASIAVSGSLTVFEFSQINVVTSLANFLCPDVASVSDDVQAQRVAVFARELRANPQSAGVLVRKLVAEVGILSKRLPDFESVGGQVYDRCRLWHDALAR